MWMDLPVVGHRDMEWVLRSMPLGGHLSSQLVVFVSRVPPQRCLWRDFFWGYYLESLGW